jgi:hypothetical protein
MPPRTKMIGDHDLALFDEIAQEQCELFGVSLEIYMLRPGENRDPLYQEDTEEVFEGPFTTYGVIEWQRKEIEHEAVPSGRRLTTDGNLGIPRVMMEALADAPRQYLRDGDVVCLFLESDGGRTWFDVKSANQGDGVAGTASFVWYNMQIKARSEAPPRARVGDGQ